MPKGLRKVFGEWFAIIHQGVLSREQIDQIENMSRKELETMYVDLPKEFREEGREESRIETAKNLLKMGLNIGQIVQATGLSKECAMAQ